jgi:acyl-CoA synthetase (AMP-forming)/AMP-acid ligase II
MSGSHATLVDLVQERAEQWGDRCLYTFLIDGENEQAHLSYRTLDQQAKAIAAALQAMGATGQRVLIVGPSGLGYIAAFFGCLYAGAIAVPVPPPDPMNLYAGLVRLQALVKDAGATILLTTRAFLSMRDAVFDLAPELKRLQWMDVEEVDEGSERDWRRSDRTPEDFALLQYTSGSTGVPKGVMISDRNLIHNCSEIHRLAGHHSGSVYVCWLPIYHNMGLIGGVLTPLYGGFTGVLMSPLSFLQRPMRWLDALSRFGGTTSPFPNFALDLCVRRFDSKQYPHLDLSRWEVACCGGEPVRSASLDRFVEVFSPYGFRKEALFPAYGLAEGTLIATGPRKLKGPTTGWFDEEPLRRHQVVDAVAANAGASESRQLVGCGRTLEAQSVIIVHPETRTRCKPDEVGEIWVAGPSVAAGYWNRPAETEATFSAFLSDTGEGPFLRTGDLGFLRGEELFITGRLKDVIIIYGKNYYPQDVEMTVEKSHPSLRTGCSAAFSIEVDGEERLVVASEIERRFHEEVPILERREAGSARDSEGCADFQKVFESIRAAIAKNHGLPIHTILLLKAESIPKTPGGKIQRHACKAGFFGSTLQVVAVHSSGDPLTAVVSGREHVRN